MNRNFAAFAAATLAFAATACEPEPVEQEEVVVVEAEETTDAE